jgi:nucleoside-diphosphate-sugar epimerase
MRKPVVLITGAGGELGQALVARMGASDSHLVTLDIQPLGPEMARHVRREFTGSVCDTGLLDRMLAEFEVDCIFHLAAILSTRAEFAPVAAHAVNVEGTLNLLEFAQKQGESHGRQVRFVYPSSIAVYGLPDAETKRRAGCVREDAFNHPTTMYGCNKLYAEELGRYFTRHYKQLSVDVMPRVDFRAVRFPGLLSAATLPAGGTSDYASEMVHAAARGEPYDCFVRPDTTIPFMAMPDAVDVLLTLAAASRNRLSRTAYNVAAFSATAAAIRDLVSAAFPAARITYKIDVKRQGIVDSWPAEVDVAAARADWDFRPAYDFDRTFREYLIPAVGRTDRR